jgi:hypothetical protein
VTPGEGEDGPDVSFQDHVRLWLEVWSADRPDLRARARRAADPDTDPWGYLACLGELIAQAD